MEALVVRLELSPEAAQLMLGIGEHFRDATTHKLTGIVPVHTRKALEKQAADIAEALREIERGIANPEAVNVPDPAE